MELVGGLAVCALAAWGGGGAARRLGVPAVVGQLAAGAAAGALGLLHPSPPLERLGEVGLVLLLFTCGLDTDLGALRAVGGPALAVAAAGVAFSMAAGWAAAAVFGLGGPLAALFCGGVLAATSVGVTATVFGELRRTESWEARIVLGAAVADDVIGLVLLGLAASVAAGGAGALAPTAVGAGALAPTTAGQVGGLALAGAAARAVGFVAGAVLLGALLSPRLAPRYARLGRAARTLLASGVCAMAAAGAGASGLAPFVGGFVGGVVIPDRPESLRALQRAAALTAPVFFVLLGSRVELAAFGRPALAAATLGVAAAGIAAKVASGAFAGRRADRLAVGIGMVPRGEVGLVFAATGLAAGALSADVYSVLVGAVILTTLAGPLWLSRRLAPHSGDS